MTSEQHETLGDAAAAASIHDDGWRLLLGGAYSCVAVGSMAAAAQVAEVAVRACGPDAAHLRLDLGDDRVGLVLRTPRAEGLTRLDTALAAQISSAVKELGLATTPGEGGGARAVQALEIAVDALDIPAVVPFWAAVLGYDVVSRPIAEGQELVVVDPAGQGPTLWFQQQDVARPQRNRIHLDVSVAEDEADARVAATLAAGGRVVSDSRARAFWVLADPEGNEACVCTWQDRD
ncbi:VOC family protein [Nocardioides mangrovicus]|uniref:VOC family protein n=1 Tax=Nocardioides mangrovicus TaxID=2478913 RepID=A0A3L8NZ34_9ACTN|nr:VOC family protein [Nocardioides mangrovicus]RLV48466.1 VOC family protein [Nocardioides mangrovicus]